MIYPTQLHVRVTAPRSDYGLVECASCNATLTQADIDAGECTQCGSSLISDDEDLYDEFDWYNANGLFDHDD